MIRLLIVHEVRLMADLTANALQMESDIEVVANVCTTEAALALLKQTKCDVLLISVTLPQKGAAALTQAVNRPKASKVLITGVVETQAEILHWLEAGAAGCILTDESLGTLVQQVRSVVQDECVVAPSLVTALIERIRELKQQIGELHNLQVLNPDTLCADLTQREYEVLRLLEQDYSNQGIGHTLHIELGTVKNHVHNILDKLGVRTRQQAATIARQALANTAPLVCGLPLAGSVPGGINKAQINRGLGYR